MENILLIDGKNTAYRALFAATGSPEFKNSGCHPFVVWLRFAHSWFEKFKPSAVHVFWDCPKNEVWRRRLLDEYKDNRDTSPHYAEDIKMLMDKILAAAYDILPNMNIRQYKRDKQESDDLIYAASYLLTPARYEDRKVIIISSDSDFLQIQWNMPHVQVYEPRKNVLLNRPEINPAIQKALVGDTADNVAGYRGIGPVKSKQLLEDYSKLSDFFHTTGSDKFKLNMALIDMSMNPANVNNIIYIMKKMAEGIKFDKAAINELTIKHKIRGLMSEYHKLVVPFKSLS